MDYKDEFSKLLFENLKDQVDIAQIKENIETPPNEEIGDLSFPCFFLAKSFKKSPKDIAENIKQDLSSDVFDFDSVNGYLNAKIKHDILLFNTVKDVLSKGTDYGKSNVDSTQYVMDVFQPNPLKTLHIGHTRNAVIGEAIHRLLDSIGADSNPVSYMGDIGTHVAKWLWYYNNHLEESQKEIPKKDVSKWFGKIYIKAGEKLAENEAYKEEVDALQVELIKNKELQEQLNFFIKNSFNAYLKVADELDLTLKKNFFESQCEHKFNEIKDDLLAKKDIFFKDEGAILADLKDEELGNFILIKSNGALLYGAKDVGLLNIKREHYPKCNHFLYVVASEQDFYFNQLFKLFEMIYPNVTNNHISFGLVNTPQGKMKSREGGMFLYENLRDALFEKVKNVLKANDLETDNDVVNSIVFGTIKFELLKISTQKSIVFDIDSATDLTGDSSAYVQYSAVRANSILEKSNTKNISYDSLSKAPLEKEELNLLRKINDLENKVKYSAQNFKPNIIANYCLEISHLFNKFYTNCQVLSENESVKNNRLLIVKSFFITLKNALYILGIEIPRKM